MMIHDLDMARFLIGEEFTEIHAVGSALIDPAIGAAGDVDTATVILKSAGGKICQISNSRRAAYGYDQRIEVHASKGLLQVGNVLETGVSFSGAKGILADPVFSSDSTLQAFERRKKHMKEQQHHHITGPYHQVHVHADRIKTAKERQHHPVSG